MTLWLMLNSLILGRISTAVRDLDTDTSYRSLIKIWMEDTTYPLHSALVSEGLETPLYNWTSSLIGNWAGYIIRAERHCGLLLQLSAHNPPILPIFSVQHLLIYPLDLSSPQNLRPYILDPLPSTRPRIIPSVVPLHCNQPWLRITFIQLCSSTQQTHFPSTSSHTGSSESHH